MIRKLIFFAVLVPFLSGCVDVIKRNTDLEYLAQQFSDAADSCLLDVRDKEIRFADSRHCIEMGRAGKAYIRPDVQLSYKGAAPRHAYIAASAKATAWSAAALSNAFHSNDPPVFSLW